MLLFKNGEAATCSYSNGSEFDEQVQYEQRPDPQV